MRAFAFGVLFTSGCLLTIDDGLVERKVGPDGASPDAASATCAASLFCEDFQSGT